MPRISSKEKIRQFFLSNIGRIVSSQEVQDASGGAGQYARRLRELREQEGWSIESHNDSADLKPGQYRLSEPPPEKGEVVFDRSISARLRAQVLERNGFSCKMCGIGADEIDPHTNRKARLHMGHIVDKSVGGKEELDNLRALCSTCNQGAKNLTDERPSWSWLKAALRRAGESECRKAYEWLRKRYGD